MIAVHKLHGNSGIFFRKFLQRKLNLSAAIAAKIPDPQGCVVAPGYLCGLSAYLFIICDQNKTLFVKMLSGRRQNEFPVFSLQKLKAKFIFQRFDLLARAALLLLCGKSSQLPGITL